MTASHPLPASITFMGQRFWTPLVHVRLDAKTPAIWCKMEFLNPSGSIKDRVAAFILGKAWREGVLNSRRIVIEASSGSTSISMAMVCAQLGVRFLAVMPEGVSHERSLMIKAYGGEILHSAAEDGIAGAIHLAEREAESRNAFLPRQFENPDNAAAHQFGTAREIMHQIPGATVDAVVSGVGTGGTLVGLYHGFMDFACGAIPVLARPTTGKNFSEAECCIFSPRVPGVVEGISKIYSSAKLAGLVTAEVDDEAVLATTQKLIRKGFPVGPSSGLNYLAAVHVSKQLGGHANIVTVFADRMERYFSTELFPAT